MEELRKNLNKVGFGLAAMFGIMWTFGYFVMPHLNIHIPKWADTLVLSAILYGIGLPILLFILGKRNKYQGTNESKLTPKQFMFCLTLQYTAFLFMIIINIIRVVVLGAPPNEQNAFGLDISSLFILLIFNPIAEEFVFRKILGDVLRPYGDKLFIFISAFCFCIVHGVALGLPQVIYTFTLGLIWAYVLVKTGNIIFPIILHALSNLFNNFVPIMAGSMAGFYTIFALLVGVVGLIMFLINRRRINVNNGVGIIDIKDVKYLFKSPGLLFYIVLTASMIVVKMIIK